MDGTSEARDASLKKPPEGEDAMTMNRRHVLAGALAAPAFIVASRLGSAAPAPTLKISPQFPGGTLDRGGFPGRPFRPLPAQPQKRTRGALWGPGYPKSSAV